MSPRARLVGIGAGWALAVALPAAVLAQLADTARADGTGSSPLLYPCLVVVLVGVGLGGWMVERTAPGTDLGVGALVGLAAITVVQLLGVLRSVAAGHAVAWASIPAVLAVGAGLGTAGTVLARHRPGRTRR